jgi:hypothetical protein
MDDLLAMFRPRFRAGSGKKTVEKCWVYNEKGVVSPF